MSLSTSDKVCLVSAGIIFLVGNSIKKQAQQNFEMSKRISRNISCSTTRISQIHEEVLNANRALLEGNKMMRELLTRKVSV